MTLYRAALIGALAIAVATPVHAEESFSVDRLRKREMSCSPPLPISADGAIVVVESFIDKRAVFSIRTAAGDPILERALRSEVVVSDVQLVFQQDVVTARTILRDSQTIVVTRANGFPAPLPGRFLLCFENPPGAGGPLTATATLNAL